MNRKGSTHYNTLAAISDTHTITDPITIQNNDRKPFQIENRMRDSFCIIVYRIIRISRLYIIKYHIRNYLSFGFYFAFGAPLMQHTNYKELKKELMSFASFSFYSLLTIAINRFSENQKCNIY